MKLSGQMALSYLSRGAKKLVYKSFDCRLFVEHKTEAVLCWEPLENSEEQKNEQQAPQFVLVLTLHIVGR